MRGIPEQQEYTSLPFPVPQDRKKPIMITASQLCQAHSATALQRNFRRRKRTITMDVAAGPFRTTPQFQEDMLATTTHRFDPRTKTYGSAYKRLPLNSKRDITFPNKSQMVFFSFNVPRSAIFRVVARSHGTSCRDWHQRSGLETPTRMNLEREFEVGLSRAYESQTIAIIDGIRAR
jgi:hypothetical protein